MAEFLPLRAEKLYRVRKESLGCDYRSLYRFERANVEWISEHFLEEHNETRGGAVTNVNKMRVFLRYVGDPGFQSGVAEDVGIHRTTANKIISEVMASILRKKNYWIKFPSSEEEFVEAQRKWHLIYRFPFAIGAMDCTHISILKPHHHGDEYINRKRFASINVQATCNSLEEFTSVDATWPGSVHDARIWRNSEISRIMEQNTANALLIGDSGYGLAPWLMTPFENPNTPQERAYNLCLAQERVIIERCFGQLKRRFPILGSKIRMKTEKVPSMIVCCFVLHNVAKRLQDPDFDYILEDNPEEGGVNPGGVGANRQVRERGRQRRAQIARIL